MSKTMSFAAHTHFGGSEYHSKYEAEGFRPFEHERRRPDVLLTSLIAAAVLSVASGAIILNRLDHLPTVNPDEAVGPVTEYTTLQWQEEAARKSGVVRGRLSVLTPPVYSNQPVFKVTPVAEKVEAEVTGASAAALTAYLDAYPSAQAAPEHAIAADIAAAEAMAEADTQSSPEPRYILEDEVAPPAQIVTDDGRPTMVSGDDDQSL